MFRTASLAAGAAAAVTVLSITAPPTPAPASQPAECFYLSQVLNRTMPDYRTMYLRLGPHRYYRIDFGADCNNVGTEPLIIHPIANNGEICGPNSVQISVARTHQGCIPTDVVRLTDAEVAAIPPKDRP